MSSIDSISQQLFETFKKTLPLPQKGWSRADGQRAIDAVGPGLNRFYETARELRRSHRPGILARARIVLAFQRQLLAAGYPADLVRQVVFSLVVSVFVGAV